MTEGLLQLGLSPSRRQIDGLLIYLEELRRWNARMNLTAIRDVEGIIVRHFLDSLAALSLLPALRQPSRPALRVLDIGTGAGFPGLPLKVCRPQLHLTLLESKAKKAAFLHVICGKLGLSGVQVLSERLEDLARWPGRQGNYDLALARGIRASTLLSHTAPLLSAQGRLVVWASEHMALEISPPWTQEGVYAYRLPFEGFRRRLILLAPMRPST